MKPKQSPNCLQIYEETTLKRQHVLRKNTVNAVRIRLVYPLLSFRFRLAPLITVVDPAFLIVLAFKLQLACHHTIGSSCSWEQWETTSSGEMLYTNISILD